MGEPTPETTTETETQTASTEEKVPFHKRFVANHPRASKALGLTAVAVVVVGAVAAVKGRNSDSDVTASVTTDGSDGSTTETTLVLEN